MSETPIQQLLPHFPEPAAKRSTRTFSYLITGLVAGLVAGYILFDGQTVLAPGLDPATKNNVDQPKDTGEVKKEEIKSDLISVSRQIPGNVVLVKSLSMPINGWIAVHDDLNGNPGKVLGAYYLPVGSYSHQLVPLLRGLEEGRSYFAVIHGDNGDKSFDFTVDQPLKDSAGAMQKATFEVSAISSRGD